MEQVDEPGTPFLEKFTRGIDGRFSELTQFPCHLFAALFLHVYPHCHNAPGSHGDALRREQS